MFCPRCRSEYRPGFSRCADCKVDLVPELAPERPPDPVPAPAALPPRDLHLVTVFSSSNPADIAVAESLLIAEGIPYMKQGGVLQDLFGYGRLELGFPSPGGPLEIQVDRTDLPRAAELLAELEEARPETEVPRGYEGGPIKPR